MSVDTPLLDQAFFAMRPFLDALAEKPEVQALYVLSSSAMTCTSRPAFTTESDFDVAVVLDVPMSPVEWRAQPAETYGLLADRIPRWLPNFEFHVPVPWGQLEVNVHQLILQYESDPRTEWNGDKCDVYSRKSQPVLDRHGRFGRIIDEKTSARRNRLSRERLRLANRLTWDVREMPLRQARRLGTEVGHYVLNLVLDELVDYLYVRANHFVPNKKWKLAQLAERDLLSAAQSTALHDILRCDPPSPVDLERRIEAFEALCRELDIVIDPGPERMTTRRNFQSVLQLRPLTFADQMAHLVPADIGPTVRDIVNYSTCGSLSDLLGTLNGDSLFGSWHPVVPELITRIEKQLTGGSKDVN